MEKSMALLYAISRTQQEEEEEEEYREKGEFSRRPSHCSIAFLLVVCGLACVAIEAVDAAAAAAAAI